MFRNSGPPGRGVGECFAKFEAQGEFSSKVLGRLARNRNSEQVEHSPPFCVWCPGGAFEGWKMQRFRKGARLCGGEASGRTFSINLPSLGYEIHAGKTSRVTALGGSRFWGLPLLGGALWLCNGSPKEISYCFPLKKKKY